MVKLKDSGPINRNIPKQGLPASPTSGLITNNSSISSDPRESSPTAPIDIEKQRIGDYYFDNAGKAHVVENSLTDLKQKYTNIVGGEKPEYLSVTDWIQVGKSAISASFLGGALGPYGRAAAGVIGGLKAYVDAETKYLDAFGNQDVEVVEAYNIAKNDDGTTRFTPDVSKMANAGELSGKGVLAANDTTKSDVSVSDDGTLNIKVSTTFLNSDEYADAIKQLKEWFPEGLTKERANQIANDDTGKTVEEEIRRFIIDEETDFYYKAQSVANFKRIAPNASEEALEQACNTQVAGFIRNKDLSSLEISIYDEADEKKTVNALDYLTEISNMSKKERNDYMLAIGNKIASSSISDDEKVILQAQANALYGASNNEDSGFEGMYLDDFADSLADANIPPFGRVGNFLGISPDLETFERNELYANTIDTVVFFGSLWAMNKLTNLAETGVRAGTTAAGKALAGKGGALGKIGEKLAGASAYAPNGEVISIPGTVLEDGTAMTMGQFLGKTATQAAFQGVADLGYETAAYAAHKATGQDFDFWGELGQDFLVDAIMTYGPARYEEAMHSDRYEIRKDKETGELYRVKLTAEEMASRMAKRMLDMTEGNAAIKTKETFFDKNAGISRVAYMAQEVAPGDKDLFQKANRYSGDIKQVTADEAGRFETSSKERRAHIQDFNQKLYDLTGGKYREGRIVGGKTFSQADANYINAKVNRRRFVREAGDNKKRKMRVIEHYKDAINGVDKERAKQLDALLASMEVVIRDSVDYYKEQGLISEEEYDRMVNSEVYKNGEFLPVWSKKRNYTGGDIMQTRRDFAETRDKNVLYDVKDFDNPLVTFGTFINNQMRNIALQKRLEVVLQIAAIPGSRINIVSEHVDASDEELSKMPEDEKQAAIGETQMVVKYSEEFEKTYQKVVEEVEKNSMTYEEWVESTGAAVESSAAMGEIKNLQKLRSERKDLQRELRRLLKEGKDMYEEGWEGDEMEKLEEDIDYVRFQLSQNKANEALTINRFRGAAYALMEERMKRNKYSKKIGVPEIDLASIEFGKGLESVLKTNNVYGNMHVYLLQQVTAVDPYVPKEALLRARLSEEAAKFRKKSIKEMRASQKNNKTMLKRIHAIADKALDKVMGSLDKEGAQKKGEAVDTSNMAGFLSTYDKDNPRTVRYYVNGVQHHVTLEGSGVEALVSELYAPEFTLPETTAGKAMRKAGKVMTAVSRGKRVLTTATDIGRVLPNLIRDWTRGIVTTGGKILLDPDALRRKAIESGKYSTEEIERINDAFELARNAISRSTFTQSLEEPKTSRVKQMILSSREGAQDKSFTRKTVERKGMTFRERMEDLPDYIKSGYIRFTTDLRTRNFVEKMSMLQDWAESYTRKRAMDTAYYSELAAAAARGETVDEQIESATEAAFFAGREATVNFARRGKLIQKFAQFVPYLSQNFSSLESLQRAYINDPIGVSNSMRSCVGAYSAMIAVALSNEESRKRYYLLSEYDRANNIIVPITNDTIVLLPLDENVAAFLTPYRRVIEALEGNDPSGFYLWGVDFLEAICPYDLSGFSEGDKFNLRRGLEKLGAQNIPTILLPLLENATGRDWAYGTDISYGADKTEMYYDNPDPTPGEMTSRSKNSKLLGITANFTGIPQWKLQNILSEYGGNVGQYALSVIDKLAGATEENTGGKDWKDSIFKPFTGSDGNGTRTAFYNGINRLNEEKAALQKKIKKINNKLEASSGEEKAKLEQERQKLISDYGVRVSDFLNQYLSAYEIAGGLTKKEAISAFYLYDIYSGMSDTGMYADDSVEGQASEEIRDRNNDRTTALAAESGFDRFVPSVLNPYRQTYGYQALKNSVYGYDEDVRAKVSNILEDTSNYNNSFTKLRSDVQDRYSKAMDRGDYDTANALAYEYDRMVLKAIAPTLQEAGLEQTLKNSKTITKYLEDWIIVPSDYFKDAKGRWVSKLPAETSKGKAFNRRFILDMYGLLDEEED